VVPKMEDKTGKGGLWGGAKRELPRLGGTGVQHSTADWRCRERTPCKGVGDPREYAVRTRPLPWSELGEAEEEGGGRY